MPAWWDRKDMPTVEERLAYLEGRFGDQATVLTDLRGDIHALRAEVHADIQEVRDDNHALRGEVHADIQEVRDDIHALRGEVHADIHEVRGDMHHLRGEVHDLRADTNAQFIALRSGLDARFAAVDARLAAMDGKFTWLIGIQVTMLLIFAGAALSMAFK